MRLRAALALAAVGVVCVAGYAAGQGFQGGLRGAIKDAGGVVPGVEVTLNNEQTNINRSTVTNDRGEYVFSSVDPGTYTVRAALQGFKKIERKNILLATQDQLTVDFRLEVGAVTESVVVSADLALIDTSTASQGQLIDRQKLVDLPLFFLADIAQVLFHKFFSWSQLAQAQATHGWFALWTDC